MRDLKYFQKGDMRKVWLILGALVHVKKPTALSISNEIGLPRSTVMDILEKIASGQIPGMVLTKEGSVYVIQEWGELINKREVTKFYKGEIKDD